MKHIKFWGNDGGKYYPYKFANHGLYDFWMIVWEEAGLTLMEIYGPIRENFWGNKLWKPKIFVTDKLPSWHSRMMKRDGHNRWTLLSFTPNLGPLRSKRPRAGSTCLWRGTNEKRSGQNRSITTTFSLRQHYETKRKRKMVSHWYLIKRFNVSSSP